MDPGSGQYGNEVFFFQMRSLINNNGCYCEIITNNTETIYYYWYKGSKFMRKYKVYFEDETETVS